MDANFQRKSYSKEELKIMIAEQLQICIEPICKEIGRAMESFQQRISDLEIAGNSMIAEMKAWKEKNYRTLQ